MSSSSRLARIADDVLSQCAAANLFKAASLNTDDDAVATFDYAYEADLRTLDDKVHVVIGPTQVTPTRSGWGSENTTYNAGIAVYQRVADIHDREKLDPLMACAEGITRLLMSATKFDTDAYCTSAGFDAGDSLNEFLKQHNLFCVVIDCVFEDNVVVTANA